MACVRVPPYLSRVGIITILASDFRDVCTSESRLYHMDHNGNWVDGWLQYYNTCALSVQLRYGSLYKKLIYGPLRLMALYHAAMVQHGESMG